MALERLTQITQVGIQSGITLQNVNVDGANVSGVVTATSLNVTGSGANFAGVVTATTFVGNVTGNINPSSLVVTGVSTFQASSHWGDGDVAYFGTDDDLLIFHNSTDSIIRDTGTGDLYIEGGNVIRMTNPTGIETYATFNQDSSVELYYDGNKKFETTGGGIIVTGVATATSGLVVSAGNVGVGTDNPTTEFEVLGGGTVASFRGTGGSSFIGIKDEDDGTLGFIGVDGGSIKLQTSGSTYADKLVVDTAGRVTMPYQPSFYTIGTNYTQATSAFSIIIPSSVSYNLGSHYNGSTGRFTAPIAGRYIFGFWGLSYPHNTEVNYIQGHVNGSGAGQLVQFNGTSTQHEECSGSLLLNLNANDIFDWRYHRSSGSAIAYTSQWNMWGYLLG